VCGCLEVLAFDVPQRDVETAQGTKREAPLPLITKLIVKMHPDQLAGERVLAEEVRAEGGDDGGVEAGRTEALAPANRAILANHLDHAAGAHRGAGKGPVERL